MVFTSKRTPVKYQKQTSCLQHSSQHQQQTAHKRDFKMCREIDNIQRDKQIVIREAIEIEKR